MKILMGISKYIGALALVALAEFITGYFPLFSHQTMFLAYNAVLISAFYLGTGPSIFAALFAILGNDYFFLVPHSFEQEGLDLLDSVVMLSLIILIVGLVHRDKLYKKKLKFHSEHDLLTGLPNRLAFETRASQVFRMAERSAKKFALFLIDLDRFKEVNDTLGHDAGDALLTEAAARLRHAVRKEDVASRIGGDEFAVLLSELAEDDDVQKIAEKINIRMAQPFTLGDHAAHISASIGVALYPRDGATLSEIEKRADIALYRTKEEGRNGYTVFGSETHRHVETYPEAFTKERPPVDSIEDEK